MGAERRKKQTTNFGLSSTRPHLSLQGGREDERPWERGKQTAWSAEKCVIVMSQLPLVLNLIRAISIDYRK